MYLHVYLKARCSVVCWFITFVSSKAMSRTTGDEYIRIRSYLNSRKRCVLIEFITVSWFSRTVFCFISFLKNYVNDYPANVRIMSILFKENIPSLFFTSIRYDPWFSRSASENNVFIQDRRFISVESSVMKKRILTLHSENPLHKNFLSFQRKQGIFFMLPVNSSQPDGAYRYYNLHTTRSVPSLRHHKALSSLLQ